MAVALFLVLPPNPSFSIRFLWLFLFCSAMIVSMIMASNRRLFLFQLL